MKRLPTVRSLLRRLGWMKPAAPPPAPYIPQPSIDEALRSLFGGTADQIHVPSVDHLCVTLVAPQVEMLLRAGGPPWTDILFQIAAKRAAAALTKNPGADPRFDLTARKPE